MSNPHRRWSAPRLPWVLSQGWVDLLFAHWPVSEASLRAHVPRGLEIDTYEGQAWLGIVPFELVGLRGRALPAFAPFPEVNVRTYVTARDRPGVFFFSLDAANLTAVRTARTVLRLPYRHAAMSIRREVGGIVYESRRREAPEVGLRVRYAPTGAVAEARPGSLEEWFTERYCLYTEIAGACWRLEIDHAPWPLQPAKASFDELTLADPWAFPLSGPPLLHFSARQDQVRAWPPCPVF
jgi:uncharacterized protein